MHPGSTSKYRIFLLLTLRDISRFQWYCHSMRLQAPCFRDPQHAPTYELATSSWPPLPAPHTISLNDFLYICTSVFINKLFFLRFSLTHTLTHWMSIQTHTPQNHANEIYTCAQYFWISSCSCDESWRNDARCSAGASVSCDATPTIFWQYEFERTAAMCVSTTSGTLRVILSFSTSISSFLA